MGHLLFARWRWREPCVAVGAEGALIEHGFSLKDSPPSGMGIVGKWWWRTCGRASCGISFLLNRFLSLSTSDCPQRGLTSHLTEHHGHQIDRRGSLEQICCTDRMADCGRSPSPDSIRVAVRPTSLETILVTSATVPWSVHRFLHERMESVEYLDGSH